MASETSILKVQGPRVGSFIAHEKVTVPEGAQLHHCGVATEASKGASEVKPLSWGTE